MTTLTITAKGQVTLKKDILDKLGVGHGDKIDIAELSAGRMVVTPHKRRTGKISDVFGMLKREGQPTLTIEEINDAIADGWAGIR